MNAVAHGRYSFASPCLKGCFEKRRVGARRTGMSRPSLPWATGRLEAPNAQVVEPQPIARSPLQIGEHSPVKKN